MALRPYHRLAASRRSSRIQGETGAHDSTTARSLLDAANVASEKVATLHIAFLAICAYVLVIVFSTTDMDLLVGKGVKLPVVDVEVPIVGFYAGAPYLLVLVHFNLLLQLQLLSRKLFAFDEAAPQVEGTGGLRDQLNIFPYNYYLVGRPTPAVGSLISVLVTVTMLLLPLACLLTLQARFLAYQSEPVVWVQRAATWLDIVLVATLWPVIMDRRDSWRSYIRGAWRHARQHWLRSLWWLAGFAMVLSILLLDFDYIGAKGDAERQLRWYELVGIAFGVWLSMAILALVLRRGWHWLRKRRAIVASNPERPVAGAFGLMTILMLGLPLPLVVVADGETLDRPRAVGTLLLKSLRHLDLHEKLLLAKPARPESIADLRGADPAKREAALRSIEHLDLQGRNFRRANLSRALMPMADLRGVQLQGADLSFAQLQGARLSAAQLQGANLWRAQLQGANLWLAQLQGAKLWEAQLQGADLSGAYLQGADFLLAQLQGAGMRAANVRGANFRAAQLQGADLSEAQLNGANFLAARLQGAAFEGTQLYPTSTTYSLFELVDVRGMEWNPLSADAVKQLQKEQTHWVWYSRKHQDWFNQSIHIAAETGLKPPVIGSCLRNAETRISCKREYSLDEFRRRLQEYLAALICESSDTAHGVLQRIKYSVDSERKDSSVAGFAPRLQNMLDTSPRAKLCPGLASLSEDDKALLRKLAQTERATVYRGAKITP